MVIITIKKLIPSIPKAYCAPIEGIHSARSMNLKTAPGLSFGNQKTSGHETRNPKKVEIFAIRRTLSFFSGRWKAMASTPTSGVKRIIVKMWS